MVICDIHENRGQQLLCTLVMSVQHSKMNVEKEVLVLEAFYGGSHRQLVDLICQQWPDMALFTMTARKWHWRARTAALYFSQNIPKNHSFKVLWSSSVLNITELIALRPDLSKCKKIVYFHENQLVYPVKKKKDRDFQYGYNQILSSLVADVIFFNSEYNLTSFLSSIQSFLKLMPDYRPKHLADDIKPKCRVLYFPLLMEPSLCKKNTYGPLHIVWPHRWEHDKNPEEFFDALTSLKEEGSEFRVSVLGERYEEVPDVFVKAKEVLKDEIVNWGYLSSKEQYRDILLQAHVVVSTAIHEFFGVAVMESILCGCYPVCPNRLVYPELLPKECLYNTPGQMVKKLRNMCRYPQSVTPPSIDVGSFSWAHLKNSYEQALFGSDDVN